MAQPRYDPIRRIITKDGNYYYVPFGSTKARNLLENYIAPNDELPVKVLLLECADFRHILHTAASSRPVHNIDFYLTNLSKSATARNVFILHIISSDKFRPESRSDLSFLWDVWYNFEWSETTRTRFLEFLSDMESNDDWKTCLPAAEDGDAVRGVWEFWKTNIGATNRKVIEKGLKMRKQRFKESTPGCAPNVAARGTTRFLSADDSFQPGVRPLKEAFLKLASKFYEKGSLKIDEVATSCLNPTLVQSNTPSWDVDPLATPLHSFYPIPNKQFMENRNVIQFCLSVLGCRIAAFRKVLKERRVKISFYIEDPIKFCWEKRHAPYDIIDTANLVDEVGLANLLLFTSGLLRDQYSLLVTEVLAIRSMDSCQSYMTEVLGVPLEMIPAIFGLRLLDNFIFGSDTPCSEVGRLNFTFSWGLPAFCTNPKPTLNLDDNEDFEHCFNSLRDKCFNEFDDEDDLLKATYTPLTLGLILRSMTTRFNFNLGETLGKIEVPPPFQMSWIVICHWLTGGRVLEYTHQRIKLCCSANNDGRSSALSFRPRMAYIGSGPFSTLSFVETLRMEAVVANEKLQHFRVSFLVPDVPNLAEFEQGRLEVFNVFNGHPLAQSTKLKQYTLQQFTGTLPELCPHSGEVPNHTFFQILSFTEQLKSYRLVLGFQRNVRLPRNAREIQITTDRVFPCSSAHEARLCAAGTNDPPLKITFSCPILPDDIMWTFCQQRRRFTVFFRKETEKPWPEDFEKAEKNQFKLDVGSLPPWPHQHGTSSILKHIEKQELGSSVSFVDPLFGLLARKRMCLSNIIAEIFKAVISGKQHLAICPNNSDVQDAGLIIQAQSPSVRYTRQGTPLVCVTVFDRLMVNQLVSKGVLDQTKTRAALAKLELPTLLLVLNVDPETLNVLRSFLSRNALLMNPTDEQKNKFPPGANEPWMASYITPVYADNHANEDSLSASMLPFMILLHAMVSAEEEFERSDANQQRRCNNCGQRERSGVPLKRCSRCRNTFYCNRQCQVGHWAAHKNECRAQR